MASYRIPGSRAKGKDNPRGGSGTRWKGQQGEPNLPDGGDQSGEGGNYQPQQEFGSWEDDKYQDILGGQTVDVHYTGGSVESPIDLDWGTWGTMVPIAMWGISGKSRWNMRL